MSRKDRIDAFGASILVASSILLGINQVMIKTTNTGIQPVFQAGLRSACAFPIILGFALIMRRRLSLSDGSLLPGIACGFLFTFEFVMLFLALDLTTVARTSVLFYTMPVWVALGAHFLFPGERLSTIRVIGLILCVIGVFVAFSERDITGNDVSLLGDILCLTAAIFWAGVALLVRATRLARSSPEMQLLYQLGVSAIVMLGVAPLFGELVRDLTPQVITLLTLQVLLVVCVGFLTWFWLLKIYPTSDVASFGFLAPLFGVISGWLLLDETISISIILALILVGSGIVLINRKAKA